MRSGNIRHKVIIQEYVEVNDGGVPTLTWVDFLTTYSQIVPRRGRETYTSNEIYATSTHVVSLRYKAGISSKMRIKYGIRIFEIISVVNIRELNKTIELYCKETEGDTEP